MASGIMSGNWNGCSRLGINVRWLERHKEQQSQHEHHADICSPSNHVAQVLVFVGYLSGQPMHMHIHLTFFEIMAIGLAVAIGSA